MAVMSVMRVSQRLLEALDSTDRTLAFADVFVVSLVCRVKHGLC